MKENIEIKDVQRTEYLDKNGLDMLWAKVKENTQNQVEVERNRAVAKENSIADTKVDKSALSKYIKIASNAETKVNGVIRTVDIINNNIGFGDNDSSLAYIGKGEIGIASYKNGYAMESFRYTTSYGLVTTNISGYKNIVIPCDRNVIKIYKYNSEAYNTRYGYNGVVLGENNDDSNLLNTNGSYKTIGTDITPLKNGKVPAEYLDLSQYAKKSEITAGVNVDDVQVNGVTVVENKIANINPATKESLGVVKVGDGLNVNAGVVSVAPDYFIDMMSYGVEWDVTVADPTCTRIGNPLFHKSLPIQSEYKGCVVKNGKLQYYLNPNDWTKTSNGSNSNLDGTDGDVMIRTPRFYGKSGSNGNKRWVRISTVQIDTSWTEIPEMFISAYRNTVYTDGDTTKVASVVSTDAKYRGGGRRSAYDEYLTTDQFKTDLGKPVSNISRATMRTYAAATGQELLCYEFYKWIFYWNYVIEYANFNSQKEFNSELTSDGYHQGGLGSGLTTWDWNQWSTYNGNYAITPCGYTNEFGNFSGVKAIQIQSPEKTLYANRWRGFENPFGDIWTNLEGIVIKRDTAKANSNVYTTTDVLKYGDDYSLFDIAGVEIAKDGWIGTFDLGSKAEIIPSSITGSESTYKCDYHWCNYDSVENRTLRVGGRADDGSPAGLGSFTSHSGVGYAYADVGFRSLVRV